MVETIDLPGGPPDKNQEYYVLGGYLSSWDQVTMATFELYRKLLDIHTTPAFLMNSLGLRQPDIRELLTGAAKLRMKPKDFKKFEVLVKRWGRASSLRNKIVHGYWELVIQVDEKGAAKKTEWVRMHAPRDMTVYDELYTKRSQRAAHRHVFKKDRIVKETNNVTELGRDLNSFVREVELEPFIDAKHVQFDKRGGGN